MFTISIGTNARCHGLCCIAVGDDAFARGAYQVVVKDKVTIPSSLTKETAVVSINELTEMRLTFQAMVDQGFAPSKFGKESADAINLLIALIEKHFGRKYQEMIEDLKNKNADASSSSTVIAEGTSAGPAKVNLQSETEKGNM